MIPNSRNYSLWEFISRRAVAFAARLNSEAGLPKGTNCSNIREWMDKIIEKDSKHTADSFFLKKKKKRFVFDKEDHDNLILARNLTRRVESTYEKYDVQSTHTELSVVVTHESG